VFFCVSLNHFIPVLLAFVVLGNLDLVSSQFTRFSFKRLAGKNVSEMTYSVSSGT